MCPKWYILEVKATNSFKKFVVSTKIMKSEAKYELTVNLVDSIKGVGVSKDGIFQYFLSLRLFFLSILYYCFAT